MALFINAVDEALAQRGLGFVGALIDIALIVALALLVNWLVKRMVERAVKRRRSAEGTVRQKHMDTAASIAISAVRYTVYFVAGALIAAELGMGESARSLLAAAGIGGVVIGIGAQSLISDVVSGIFLLLEDQFSVGDYIGAAGVTGTVEAITLRTTTIRAYTGELTTIPNGSIKALTNYSRTDTLCVVDVPIAIGADAERALRLMEEEAMAYYAELGEEAVSQPEILGVAAAQNGVKTLRSVMLVKPLKHWAAQRELTRRTIERFAAEGIALPYESIGVKRGICGDDGGEDGQA